LFIEGNSFESRKTLILTKKVPGTRRFRFDLNYIDDLGCTHFHVACEYGWEDVVQKFLELGQDPNLLVQKTGNSPLYLALRYNFEKEVTRLLLKHGADPNVANKDGRTPLHGLGENRWVCPDMEMMFELKKKLKPGQVDARDKLGNTPLHLAGPILYSNANHVIRALLEIGANPNVANDEGLTPMHIICKKFYKDSLWELFCQISDGMKQPVQLDARDKLGNTPLHLAALLNDYKSLEFLLRNGADPNAVNEEGLTPLHIIAMTDQFCTLARSFFNTNKELNQLVQVDVRDKLGRTPLQLAVANLLPHKRPKKHKVQWIRSLELKIFLCVPVLLLYPLSNTITTRQALLELRNNVANNREGLDWIHIRFHDGTTNGSIGLEIRSRIRFCARSAIVSLCIFIISLRNRYEDVARDECWLGHDRDGKRGASFENANASPTDRVERVGNSIGSCVCREPMAHTGLGRSYVRLPLALARCYHGAHQQDRGVFVRPSSVSRYAGECITIRGFRTRSIHGVIV
ncbi:unnamed protein product, partial [Trichogramma brassicae]